MNNGYCVAISLSPFPSPPLYLFLSHSFSHSTLILTYMYTFRSRPLIGVTRDHLLDEQVFEEEFSPVRRRSRSATEVVNMLKPPEPVLSAIK